MHEFLVRTIREKGVAFQPLEKTVTYHDPCRLGRMAGIYDAPRELLQMIPGIQLVEMERSRENGVCCGTSGWMNCSSCSKAIQVERLQEALSHRGRDPGDGLPQMRNPSCAAP